MKYIPYGFHWIDKDDRDAVCRTLKSDWVTQGPAVKSFENALCKYTGAAYAVAVSNGTAALHIACLAAGVTKGDEIITSPLTFVASANCALYCGAKPIFADIEEDTGNIDPSKIKRAITRKTKVLIPVHFAGHPCDMNAVHEIAKNKKLIVIEDAAHALGSRYNGNKISKVGSGVYSDMTTLSFHPVKHITTGEGGAVLTNRKDLYDKLLMLRSHGITKDQFVHEPHGEWYYEMQALGYNYRITDIQCALGESQLKKLPDFINRRREIVARYNKAFEHNPYFDVPPEKGYAFSSYHLYPIRLKEQFIPARKQIFSGLRKAGIGVQVHYIPVYLQPYYERLGYLKGACPKAERFYASEISLPLYPLMKTSDIAFVIKKVFDVLGNLYGY